MKRNREDIVQVVILIAVASMAGAASFTHVHNWTMHNAPAGTGSWFGWANAVISELTPTAAGIEIRRRRRRDAHAHIAYPMAILIAAAVLSLSAQVSEALPTIGGWVSSAVPALAFLALTKLVLSRSGHNPEKENPECAAQSASASDAPQQMTVPGAETTTDVSATATSTTSTTPSTQGNRSSSLDAHALTASHALTTSPSRDIQSVPSDQLRMSAGMIAFNHEASTGKPITPGELAGRLNVPPVYAESLLDHLGGNPPSVTVVNGTAMNGSRP